MEHYPPSVKPYAYLRFAGLSFVIIAVAAAFAGPISGWTARRFFPNSEKIEVAFNLIAALLATVIGFLALFMASAGTAGTFNDPLPSAARAMRVRFPENTKLIFHKAPAWEEKLIVSLDADGWEEFRRSELFQTQPLKIASADKAENSREWQTFETNKNAAQSYRWTNHDEPNRLQVLARRAEGDGQIYVYLYRRNGAAANRED